MNIRSLQIKSIWNISEHGRIRDQKWKWTGFQNGYITITMNLKLMFKMWCTNQVIRSVCQIALCAKANLAPSLMFPHPPTRAADCEPCSQLISLPSQHTGSCFHMKTVRFIRQETSWMVKTPSPSVSLGERKWQCGSRLYHQLRDTLRPPSKAHEISWPSNMGWSENSGVSSMSYSPFLDKPI